MNGKVEGRQWTLAVFTKRVLGEVEVVGREAGPREVGSQATYSIALKSRRLNRNCKILHLGSAKTVSMNH